MNKTQTIEVVSKLRDNNYLNNLDELKIVLRMLEDSPFLKEHTALQDAVRHIRGIISLENEKLNERTQSQFDEIYENR